MKTLPIVLVALIALAAGVLVSVHAQTDTDGDGFSDSIEYCIGTDPLDDCPDLPWHDAWPLDIDTDPDIFDVMKYVGVVGIEPPVYVLRLDLDCNSKSDIFDVMKFIGVVAVPGKDICTNP